MQIIAPLAQTLKVLMLSGNEMGGEISDVIAKFAELSTLDLSRMRLKGKVVSRLTQRSQSRNIPAHSL